MKKKEMNYTIFQANGDVENGKRTEPFTLKEIQTIVGGFIEIHEVDGRWIVCDEEGKLKGKPLNILATDFFQKAYRDVIVGDALICEKGLIN